MSDPKEHHYVPRRFFKPWANEHKKLWVYEKKAGRIIPPYRQSTKVICVKENLYAYTDTVARDRKYIIENKLMSVIDSIGGGIINHLLQQNGMINVTDSQRYDFSVFLVSLRLRTPEAIKASLEQTQDVLRQNLMAYDPEIEKLAQQGIIDKEHGLLKWTEKNKPEILENFGLELMAKFFVDRNFVMPIFNMYWAVIDTAKAGIDLITCDRPMIVYAGHDKPNFGVAIALSPDKAFFASKDIETVRRILRLDRRKFAKNINISTVQQAHSKAFALKPSHSPRFFENRLGTHNYILPYADYFDI